MSSNKKLAARLKKSHADFAALVRQRVGARIAERRAAAGITLADMGMPMGVTLAQAQRYEAGVTPLDIAGLLSVARTLGCKPSDLLVDFDGGAETPPALSRRAVLAGQALDRIPAAAVQDILVSHIEAIADAYEAPKKP